MAEKKESLKSRLSRTFRRRMVSGMLVLVPVGITLLVLRVLYLWIYDLTKGGIRKQLENWQPWLTNFPDGLTWVADLIYVLFVIILALVIVYVVGAIATRVAGRQLIDLIERIVLRIPIVKSIYSAAKGVMEAVALPDKKSFRAVVMMEFPRKGIKSIGFLTGQVTDTQGRIMLKVFLPTSPNPTTGFLEIVEPEEVEPLDMTVEEAFKMLISGGLISPETLRRRTVDLTTVPGLPPTVVDQPDSMGGSSPSSSQT